MSEFDFDRATRAIDRDSSAIYLCVQLSGALSEIDRIDARLVSLQCRVETLFDAIKHGDDAHQAWLKQKITEHFA